MEQYFKVLPFFIFAVSTGIGASFLFGRDQVFEKKRIVKEIFGGFWISIISYVLLDEMTTLIDVVLFAITSIIAFLNSQLISFIGNDLVMYLGKGVGRFIKNLADKIKSNENDWDDSPEDEDENSEPKLE